MPTETARAGNMVLETIRLLRNWLAMHRRTGVHMDAETVEALISLLSYYESEHIMLQARVTGTAVPIDPSGNVVRFPLVGRDAR